MNIKYLSIVIAIGALILVFSCSPKQEQVSGETKQEVVKESPAKTSTNDPNAETDPSKVDTGDKDVSEAAFQAGFTAHNAGDFKEAIQQFSKSIELNATRNDAWGFRGMSRFKSGDVEGACADWKKAAELGYSGADGLIASNCK